MSRYLPGWPQEVVPRALAERIAGERDALAGQLDRALREIDALRRALEARERQVLQLDRALRAMRRAAPAPPAPGIEELQERLRQVEAERDALAHEQEALEREARRQAARAEAAEAERDAARAELEALRAELEAERAELLSARAELERAAARPRPEQAAQEGTGEAQARSGGSRRIPVRVVDRLEPASREAGAGAAGEEPADRRTAGPDPRERLQRVTAELENLRRQTDARVASAREEERSRLLRELLELRDALSRALDVAGPQQDPWVEGMETTLGRLDHLLQREGAELIGQPGERFDPHVHEAIDLADHPEGRGGVVVRVVRPGLKLGDRLVRPARVVVSR